MFKTDIRERSSSSFSKENSSSDSSRWIPQARRKPLVKYFTYNRSNKGRTSGSRVMFVSDEYAPILLHKPHPRKELLDYQIKQLIEVLEQEGLI